MNYRKYVAPIMVAMVVHTLSLIIIGCQSSLMANDLVDEPYVSGLAPDFTVVLLDEKILAMDDLRGRPIILNFWATWCAPCRQEMPLIEALYTDRAEDGLVVLAINYGESEDTVTDFMAEAAYTFPIALDPDLTLAQSYLVRGMPTTYFIDRDGVIQQVHIGEMTSDILQSYVAMIDGS